VPTDKTAAPTSRVISVGLSIATCIRKPVHRPLWHFAGAQDLFELDAKQRRSYPWPRVVVRACSRRLSGPFAMACPIAHREFAAPGRYYFNSPKGRYAAIKSGVSNLSVNRSYTRSQNALCLIAATLATPQMSEARCRSQLPCQSRLLPRKI
jgi:hypothetical protein